MDIKTTGVFDSPCVCSMFILRATLGLCVRRSGWGFAVCESRSGLEESASFYFVVSFQPLTPLLLWRGGTIWGDSSRSLSEDRRKSVCMQSQWESLGWGRRRERSLKMTLWWSAWLRLCRQMNCRFVREGRADPEIGLQREWSLIGFITLMKFITRMLYADLCMHQVFRPFHSLPA